MPEATGSTEVSGRRLDEAGDPGLHAHTRAIQAGRADNQNALAPILWSTSTFTAPSVQQARALAVDAHPTRFYTRYGNPTVKAFEDAVANLEGTESARAFRFGDGGAERCRDGVVLER